MATKSLFQQMHFCTPTFTHGSLFLSLPFATRELAYPFIWVDLSFISRRITRRLEIDKCDSLLVISIQISISLDAQTDWGGRKIFPLSCSHNFTHTKFEQFLQGKKTIFSFSFPRKWFKHLFKCLLLTLKSEVIVPGDEYENILHIISKDIPSKKFFSIFFAGGVSWVKINFKADNDVNLILWKWNRWWQMILKWWMVVYLLERLNGKLVRNVIRIF